MTERDIFTFLGWTTSKLMVALLVGFLQGIKYTRMPQITFLARIV